MHPVFTQLAKAVNLHEGGAGVRRIFLTLANQQPLTSRKLAQLTNMPIPIIAALRREMEKNDLINRSKKGMQLSPHGEKLVRQIKGNQAIPETSCSLCKGKGLHLGKDFETIKEQISQWGKARPKIARHLDQSHGTPENVILRAVHLLFHSEAVGSSLVFLGDDDLLGLTTALIVKLLLGSEALKVMRFCILEIDTRLVDFIDDLAHQEDLPIECCQWDLRQPVPLNWRKRFDVFLTDPPYTLAGAQLFVSRGIDLLHSEGLRRGYLAFSYKSTEEWFELQESLTAMGVVIRNIIPGFNEYEGAAALANQSTLITLEVLPQAFPLISGQYQEPLYTGEYSPKIARDYLCLACQHKIMVEKSGAFPTISALVAAGCPKCGGKKFIFA